MRSLSLLAASASAARPAAAGARVSAVATPALLLDLDAFDRNCATLRDALAGSRVRARPHAKAHKSGALALRQKSILGDVMSGVCAQTVLELEAMVDAGVDDVLLTNEVVGADKLERFAACVAAAAAQGGRVGVLVDDASQIAALDAAVAGPVDVYVEVDVGQNRCGVAPAGAAPLAEAVAKAANLRFAGAHCYHGLIQHVPTDAARREAVAAVASEVRATRAALEAVGLPPPVVTGGGTGTMFCDVASGVFDEVQPGSFCLMDGQYLALDRDAAEPVFERSLHVLSTVMSRPVAARAVVDAGSKAVDLSGGLPTVEGGRAYRPGGDEHGVVDLVGDDALAVGDKVLVSPAHCDPTVNMHDYWVLHSGDVVEDVIRVDARGPGL